jgi:sigma-B regulation protein RsbU (phosphoserine phosphatase)
LPTGWTNVHGLLFYGDRFGGWAHYIDRNQEITVVAPFSDEMIADLVPHLGVIALGESNENNVITTGALSGGSPSDARIPAPVSRLDLPIAYFSQAAHMHLDQPGSVHHAILWVHSRPSAVLRAVFSDADLFRGVAAIIIIGVAVLFLLVEAAAVAIGISLSRRITRSVNELYEGTRQVISGDLAHRIPTTRHDQLGDLADSFNQMTGHLERLLISEKEHERIQAELEIAREVQGQLYPRGQAPECGLRLLARCDPARTVSGDYYDYQLVGHNKLAFAIGDVAGKGISAALLMATIQSALRAQLSQSQPQKEGECSHVPEIASSTLVSKINKQVFAHTAPEKYATFFFGLFDNATCTLTYTNAGHLSPLLFRNGSVVPLDTNGMVVGAFANASYDESCVTLEPDDLLVCYTDGITEPENEYGEMFGDERLIDLVQKHQHADESEIIRVIFDAVRGWTASAEAHDDMTLLLARRVVLT